MKSASACCSSAGSPWSRSEREASSRSRHGSGRDEPAEPQRRRQRLGDRADVDHEVRPQALERADRRAVVAVLGVVVVLDDQRVPLLGPAQQRGPPLGAEHDARRELVRGRDEHGAGVVRERVDHDALRVDRHRHGLEPAARQQGADLRVPRVLDREPRRRDRVGDGDERLRRARADQHALGGRERPAHAPPVGRQHGSAGAASPPRAGSRAPRRRRRAPPRRASAASPRAGSGRGPAGRAAGRSAPARAPARRRARERQPASRPRPAGRCAAPRAASPRRRVARTRR